MASFGDNSRVKGLTLVKSIVYGNTSNYFGKKRETDGHTHGWKIYLKPFKNEDMSTYVKKVHFKLHESYPNPLRVVTKPPYEVNESGWGEFEIIIKIFWMDPTERPVTLYHLLKLFQTESALASGKKHLVSEWYDEIIFQDPTQMMNQCLLSARQLPPIKHEHDWAPVEERTTIAITNAREKICKEIAELNDRLKISRESIHSMKQEISKAEKDQEQSEKPSSQSLQTSTPQTQPAVQTLSQTPQPSPNVQTPLQSQPHTPQTR